MASVMICSPVSADWHPPLRCPKNAALKRWFIFDEIPIGRPAFPYPVTRFESSADSKPCDPAGENGGQRDPSSGAPTGMPPGRLDFAAGNPLGSRYANGMAVYLSLLKAKGPPC
jgi:hypothetical protein